MLFEYPVTHPYPYGLAFNIATIFLVALALPPLILLNIITSGYELVPVLRPNMNPNDTTPEWWNLPHLSKFLRRKPPPCEPKDFGRGDRIRLTPSLFEYNVLSAWRNSTERDPRDETRVEYYGAAFNACFPYQSRFDWNAGEYTQTLTTAVRCPRAPIDAFLETSITVAWSLSKDVVGQYYGANTDLFDYIDENSRDYRKAVFGMFDVISTDSLGIMREQHLSSTITALSTTVNVSHNDCWYTSITYLNGTVEEPPDGSFGSAGVYADSIYNLVAAVADAIYLDLGNARTDNIFLSQSSLNEKIVPNLAPRHIDNATWDRDTGSFYYGHVVPPYRTWAQMLLAGLPQNLTLGNLTGLPESSYTVTNYLCPMYQVKPMPSFLASVFVGTASMFLSSWAAWMTISTLFARRISGPCLEGSFNRQPPCNNQNHRSNLSGAESTLVAAPALTNRNSNYIDEEKK